MSAIWGEEARGGRRSLPVDRSGRHGHAAACARRSRRRPVDAEAAGACGRGAHRAHRRRASERACRSRAGLRMIAADHPHRARRPDASRRPARRQDAHLAARRTWLRCSRRATSSSRTTPRRCPRASTARMLATGEPIEFRLAAWIGARRSDALRRDRVRRGRLPHAHRRPRRRLPPLSRRHARARSARRDDRPRPRIIRGCRAVASPGHRMRFWPDWRGTAGRSSTRTSASRWRSGTSGRRSPARPLAFEPPSAGFALDWRTHRRMATRAAFGFATLTHAAGISSTGDPALDDALPFDEPYRIPVSTAAAIDRSASPPAAAIVAIGTTVVRALEAAAHRTARSQPATGSRTGASGRRPSSASSTPSSQASTQAGESHFELLRAFAERTRRSSGWRRRSRRTAIAITSSATPC